MITERFTCKVCGKDFDTDHGLYEPQLEGLVCKDCATQVFYAVKYLNLAGINRPLTTDDVNHSNAKRFIVP